MSFRQGAVDICRACINECIDYRPIHCQELILGKLSTLATILGCCTNVDFPDHEYFLPGNLCNGCIQNLFKFYAFKQMVVKSDKTLRQRYSELNRANQQVENWQELAASGTTQEQQNLDHSYVKLVDVNDKPHQPFETPVHNKSNDDHQQLEEWLLEPSEEEAYHEEELEVVDEKADVRVEKKPETVNEKLQNTKINQKIESVSTIVTETVETLKVLNTDWQCPICDKLLSNMNSFRIHIQKHCDTTHFLCNICGEGFKTRYQFEGHMSIHDPKPSTCKVCGKSFTHKSIARTHMKLHTRTDADETTIVSCEICGKGLTSTSGYNKHKRTHTGDKPYKCDKCGLKFSTSSNKTRHTRKGKCDNVLQTRMQLKRRKVLQTRAKPYSCKTCSLRFNKPSYLSAHMRLHKKLDNHDLNEKNTLKNVVGETLPRDISNMSEDNLMETVRQESVAMNESNWPQFNHLPETKDASESCHSSVIYLDEEIQLEEVELVEEELEELFKVGDEKVDVELEELLQVAEDELVSVTIEESLSNVPNSVITSSLVGEELQNTETSTAEASNNVKPSNIDWQCPVCDKQLSNKYHFISHVQQHCDSTHFLCSICGEGFKTQNTYDSHMTTHDLNNPNKCKICGKSYRQKSTLQMHMLTHSEEWRFKCDICGKGTMLKTELKSHMLIHTGEKPHQCDVCGRDFRHRSNLLVHKRYHTGERLQCPMCDKTFQTPQLLKRHSSVHSDEKPFSCHICGRHLKYRITLKQHLQWHEKMDNRNTAEKNSLAAVARDKPKSSVSISLGEMPLRMRFVEHY